MPKSVSPALARIWAMPYALLTLTALFWAGNSVVARGARDVVPPAALSFWRWALALVILLPLAWPHLKRDAAVLRAGWKPLVLMGVLGVGAFNTLLYQGLQVTTAVNGLLLQSMQPGLILAMGVLMFGDPAGRRQWLGVVLSVAGAVLIITRGDFGVLATMRFNRGDLVIGIAVVCWSLYSTLLRTRPVVHPLSFLAATGVIGLMAVLPVYVAELVEGRLIVARAESWLAIGYVALLPSLIAYLCFNRGVQLVGAAPAMLYLNIMPVIGAGLAALFLGEAILWYHFAGMGLIGLGIVAAVRRRG
ncbi:DMT family transporter [Polymorphobacter sp.]|uniref:DMT family transporter n=1 Tax=Polymorphobacter sp. TaxID=1909290 RepID=UPI003F715123